jgi:hypothetical protein
MARGSVMRAVALAFIKAGDSDMAVVKPHCSGGVASPGCGRRISDLLLAPISLALKER